MEVAITGGTGFIIFPDNVIEVLVRCGRMAPANGRAYNLSDQRTIEEFDELKHLLEYRS